MQSSEGAEPPPSPPPQGRGSGLRKPTSASSLPTPTQRQAPPRKPHEGATTGRHHFHYNSFNRYEEISFKEQLRAETVKIKNIPDTHAEWKKTDNGGNGKGFNIKENTTYNHLENVIKNNHREPRILSHDINTVDLLYKLSTRSTDGDSINSYKSDLVKNKSLDQPSSQYVDMGRPAYDTWEENPSLSLLEHERDIGRRPFYPAKDETPGNGKRIDRMARRYTTEYRAPPQLVLPTLKNDSSDSAERSPVAVPTSKSPYPYLALTEQRAKKKKKSSITSSTSEDNSDNIAAAIKLRVQAEWRENIARRGLDTQTVDRRSSKKHASKSAKMKRQGSFNIDPAGEFHLSLDVNRSKDMSCSVRSCNPAKSPLMDARKTPLQISAEDMVQIANCGARNKNGSLCHFISTNDDNYLSISQALLNQSSGSEAKLTDTNTLTRKIHTLERKKKSTHSLAFESSDETLCQQDKPVLKDRREDKMLAKKRENDTKVDTLERRHKGHSRQRSHDLEKSLKSAKYRQDSTPGRKLVHTKSEGQRSHKIPTGYFLLEDENGHTVVPLRLPSENQKENIKYQSPSTELLDKRSNVLSNEHHKEACKCLIQSNHCLVKADCSYREKSDFSSDTDPGNPAFRRLGTSSREELTNSGGDVEESFDF